jgi:predicted protein tyrosine phosphatase
MKKVLFVCSGNKLRSPTAEFFYKDLGLETKSAGTSHDAKHEINIDDIKWADKIVVMEDKHRQRILAKFSRAMQFKDIEVLNIPDNFKFMDNALIEVFKQIEIS